MMSTPAFPGMGSPLLKKLMYILLITLLKDFIIVHHKLLAQLMTWSILSGRWYPPCTFFSSFFFFFDSWKLQKRIPMGKSLGKEKSWQFCIYVKISHHCIHIKSMEDMSKQNLDLKIDLLAIGLTILLSFLSFKSLEFPFLKCLIHWLIPSVMTDCIGREKYV